MKDVLKSLVIPVIIILLAAGVQFYLKRERPDDKDTGEVRNQQDPISAAQTLSYQQPEEALRRLKELEAQRLPKKDAARLAQLMRETQMRAFRWLVTHKKYEEAGAQLDEYLSRYGRDNDARFLMNEWGRASVEAAKECISRGDREGAERWFQSLWSDPELSAMNFGAAEYEQFKVDEARAARERGDGAAASRHLEELASRFVPFSRTALLTFLAQSYSADELESTADRLAQGGNKVAAREFYEAARRKSRGETPSTQPNGRQAMNLLDLADEARQGALGSVGPDVVGSCTTRRC